MRRCIDCQFPHEGDHCPRCSSERSILYRWYLTAAAVRQWLAITHRKDDDGGPVWAAAERELGELADDTRRTSQHSSSGAEVWRANVTIGGRRRRVELTVMPDPRPEGPLPQLLQVRIR